MFKLGDLVLYDRYGSRWESVSPSFEVDDYAIGIVLQIIQENSECSENVLYKIMKENGIEEFFSIAYLQKACLNIQNERMGIITHESSS